MAFRWRLYSGIGTVFLLGGVAGGLVGISGERDRLRRYAAEGPEPALGSLIQRLDEELKLDESQSRRIREVYAATRPQLLLMERERRRRLRQLMDSTQPAIREVLTPPQRERFDQLQQKLQFRLRLQNPPDPENSPDRKTEPPDPAELRRRIPVLPDT